MPNKVFKFLYRFNLKSLYFNFRYLPFRQAILIPILVSRKVRVERVGGSVQIKGALRTGLIQIGYGDVSLFDKRYSRSMWQVEGAVVFRGKAHLGHGSKISVAKAGYLEFGARFEMTAESSIVVQKDIRFGDECLVSWECLIMDTDFHRLRDKRSSQVLNKPKAILIGDKNWIGCRSTVLKGTKTAKSTVLAANSLVNKDISSMSGLYAGSPVVLKREEVAWDYEQDGWK